MGSVARTLIFTILLAAVITAQKDCYEDADCMENQYCYTTNLCANYTLCSRYNRIESINPSRHPSQCGPCLEGYSADRFLGPDEEGEKCSKNPAVKEEDTSGITIPTWAYVFLGILGIIVIVLHCIWHKCKTSCQDRTPPEKSSALLMFETGNGPSAPPLPLVNGENNNDYHVVDETNRLTTIGDHRIDKNRLSKAQPFCPPHNIRVDQNYNPGDNPNVQATSSPPEFDEDTIPDNWTPGPAIPIQNRPFRTITEEQVDNSTNAARDGACPSSSANQNGGENGQGNNGTTGNMRGNPNASSFTAMVQVQVVNNINQGSNGS